MRCVSLSEANAILAGCKRLEKEIQRRERLRYQERLASLHQPSRLSATAAPFEPQVALPTPGLAGTSSGPLERQGSGPQASFSLTRNPTTSPVGKLPPPARGPYPQTLDDDATSDVGLVDPSSRKKGRRSWGNRGSRGSDSSDGSHSTKSTTTSGGRRKKKDGFSSKIQIPVFGGKKGHLGDVTDAFRQWARCITYYRDYYEDSYLMPLVVSSLTGDASDVFDWILSLNHGEPQDLTTLLQMLREHYCGSLTFREQRNMMDNLCQKPNEAAIDFLIRVSTSVSNLAKDWKDELSEGELQALQYEVSLNGVKEEIRHVLDSEMAKRDGHLTPQQMYEAVKRYETYVAWNKRLDGKGASILLVSKRPTVIHQATSLSSKRQPRLQPQPRGQVMKLVTTRTPRIMRRPTPRRLSLPTGKMRGCTFPVTSKKLFLTTLRCKSEWLGLCEFKRRTPRGALPAIGQATLQGIIRNGRKKMEFGPFI